jgi:hypothetical protein
MARASRLVLALLASACGTPSALQFAELTPTPQPGLSTAKDLYANTAPEVKAKAPINAADIAIVSGDGVIGAFTLYELRDIIWLDVYVYNNHNQGFLIGPSSVVLLDGNRTALRQLAPHEAANIYLGQVTGIPPYQGYAYTSGQYTRITAQTQGTVTPREDPYNALGYSIGAAIAASRNRKFRNMAGTLYTVGFVANSSVPAKAGARGGIYWLKPRNWVAPLILRFTGTGYEVRFAPQSAK